MARASRNVRKMRRLKRENTLAYRLVDHAVKERDFYRTMLEQVADKLKKDEEAKSATSETSISTSVEPASAEPEAAI